MKIAISETISPSGATMPVEATLTLLSSIIPPTGGGNEHTLTEPEPLVPLNVPRKILFTYAPVPETPTTYPL